MLSSIVAALAALSLASAAPLSSLTRRINPGNLPISIINNYQGGNVNAYITGLDPNNGNKRAFIRADGSFFYPQTTSTTPTPITDDVAIPLGAQGSSTNVTTPGFISSARVYFVDGTFNFNVVVGADGVTSLVEPTVNNPQDANINSNWGFVEFTYDTTQLFANLSEVDFVGFVLGLLLNADSGTTTAKGLPAGAVGTVCNDLQAQASKDGQPWDKLCYSNNGNLVRILAPADYISGYDQSAFGGYFDDYVNSVWGKYTSTPLMINTPNNGIVSCTVSGDTLNCAGDNRGYAKPSSADIFGCNSGPFLIQDGDNDIHKAVVPRLCAAIHRSTLLLDDGNTQPGPDPSEFYTVDPTDYYSKIVHNREIDHRGYAFSYDDVKANDGADQAGTVQSPSPQLWTIYAGGSPQ